MVVKVRFVVSLAIVVVVGVGVSVRVSFVVVVYSIQHPAARVK